MEDVIRKCSGLETPSKRSKSPNTMQIENSDLLISQENRHERVSSIKIDMTFVNENENQDMMFMPSSSPFGLDTNTPSPKVASIKRKIPIGKKPGSKSKEINSNDLPTVEFPRQALDSTMSHMIQSIKKAPQLPC